MPNVIAHYSAYDQLELIGCNYVRTSYDDDGECAFFAVFLDPAGRPPGKPPRVHTHRVNAKRRQL